MNITKLLTIATIFVLTLLTGCSEKAKTEEEIRAEVKAELQAEAEKDKLKEELKEEIKNELASENTESTDSASVAATQPEVETSISIEPYVTTNLTFSNFNVNKQSDGYLLIMDTENTNTQYSVAFGWGTAGTATLVTTEGEYTANFPHMEQLGAGVTKSYTFKFTNAMGEPKELIIDNVNLVNKANGKLPTPGQSEKFIISLK
ncbi:hypothetical protein [Bacillus pinisoli]|uniref:hypothetical protein n=1 Tax=Bacillus pinisoli TaxID=2901866 RepID=UPI001FF2FBC5|nr:hypothetical protein [Bacillus pinisoli]